MTDPPAPGAPLGGGPVDAVIFDYGVTLVRFSHPDAALEGAQLAVVRLIAAAGQMAPPVGLLRTAVHDRVEREVLAHDASGALEELDVAALERRAFADIGLHLDDATLDACSSVIQEAWLQGVHLCSDALPTLRRLRAAGLRVGLCSNAPYRPASMHAQLRHLGLAQHLDGAVFSGELGWRKPSPHLFVAAMQALACQPAAAVFVGDRPREDVGGAHAIGMRAVLIVRDDTSAGGAVEQADAVISTLAELPSLLEARLRSNGV